MSLKDSNVVMTQEFQEAINLLDEKLDSKWVFKINLTTLDIQSASECILGQLFGDFIKGANILCPWWLNNDDDPLPFGGGNETTREWERIIIELREERE